MFCEFCGKKIESNGKTCPYCGRGQEQLVNGNCFWDLCGGDVPLDDREPVFSRESREENNSDIYIKERTETVSLEAKRQNQEIILKDNTGIRIALLSICTILLLVNVLLLFRITLEVKSITDGLSILQNDILEAVGATVESEDAARETEMESASEMETGENVTDKITDETDTTGETEDATDETEDVTDEIEETTGESEDITDGNEDVTDGSEDMTGMTEDAETTVTVVETIDSTVELTVEEENGSDAVQAIYLYE